ncbi:MAG: Rid family hydrolase [Acidimicrobiaceae bacterium]|nr:Rid family hydrolase [Acidimicrobiaceae bacterium]
MSPPHLQRRGTGAGPRARGAHPGGCSLAARAGRGLIGEPLAQGGGGGALSDVVRTRVFLTDISKAGDYGRAHGEVFGDIRPAATLVEVSALVHPDLVVEIEVDAIGPPDWD